MKSFLLFLTAFMLLGIATKAQTYGTMTDARDGRVYKTVKIGTQTWMAENLSFKTSSGSWAYNILNRIIKIT